METKFNVWLLASLLRTVWGFQLGKKWEFCCSHCCCFFFFFFSLLNTHNTGSLSSCFKINTHSSIHVLPTGKYTLVSRQSVLWVLTNTYSCVCHSHNQEIKEFHRPQNLPVPLVGNPPPSPPASGNHGSIFRPYTFTFPRMPCQRSHMPCSFWVCLLSLSTTYLRFIRVVVLCPSSLLFVVAV